MDLSPEVMRLLLETAQPGPRMDPGGDPYSQMLREQAQADTAASFGPPSDFVPERPARMGSTDFGGEALDDVARALLAASQNMQPRTNVGRLAQGFAQGFGQVRSRRADQREAINAGENQRATMRTAANIESAKERRARLSSIASSMATHRHQMERDRKKAAADAAAAKAEREWQTQEKRLDRAAYGNPRSGAGLAPGSGGVKRVFDGTDRAWADYVKAGQATLASVPREGGRRDRVVTLLAEEGSEIIPQKVRDTKAALAEARGVINSFESLVASVNTGRGLGRLAAGAGSLYKGATQEHTAHAVYDTEREGMLAVIARAVGEKGVLTDRDSDRANKLMPSRFDTRAVAERKLQGLRRFLDEKEREVMRAYMGDVMRDPGAFGTARPGNVGTGTADPMGIR